VSEKLPQPATGLPGFGCSFVLVFAAGTTFLLSVNEVSTRSFGLLALVAVALGLLTARFGEKVFELVLRLASLLSSW